VLNNIYAGSANYIRGKQMRLRGEPIPPMPEKGRHSQSVCDLRSGWRVADTNIATHPEWTHSQILA